MKDGEHSFEDDLALLVAKEDMIRIKAFCGMAEPCGIEACLAAAADAFHDDRLCRIEGDICSFVWHDDEKRCARFTLAADWTGRPCLDVYIEDRDLAVSDRETIRKLKLNDRVTVSGTLALYGGAVQFQGRSRCITALCSSGVALWRGWKDRPIIGNGAGKKRRPFRSGSRRRAARCSGRFST